VLLPREDADGNYLNVTVEWASAWNLCQLQADEFSMKSSMFTFLRCAIWEHVPTKDLNELLAHVFRTILADDQPGN
jgi:hypothetical protein